MKPTMLTAQHAAPFRLPAPVAYSFLLLDCYKTQWFIILHDGLVALEFLIHLNKDITLFVTMTWIQGQQESSTKATTWTIYHHVM